MDDQVIYSDPRLTTVLKEAREYATKAYACLTKNDMDNAKLYLANLIGTHSTLYELYRPEERLLDVSKDAHGIIDIEEKTRNFMSKFGVK